MRRLIYSALCLLVILFTLPAITAADLINVDFIDMEVRDILKALSVHTGVNIVPDRNVQGKLSTYLKDVTIDQALDLILTPNGFTYSEEKGIYKDNMAHPPRLHKRGLSL